MQTENLYRSWKDFEMSERRRVGTFQLSVDDLAEDLYIEPPLYAEDQELSELNFE
jgi:hypothetical protein